MNQSALLHIVERLEGFVGKLPDTIQKPILRELTPLKELFLQQRPPRFVLTGPDKSSLPEAMATLFAPTVPAELGSALMESGFWQDVKLGEHGSVVVLDARGIDVAGDSDIQAELKHQPPDVIFFLDQGEGGRSRRKTEIENFELCRNAAGPNVKTITIVLTPTKNARGHDEEKEEDSNSSSLQVIRSTEDGDRPLRTLHFSKDGERSSKELMSILAREVPNEARIEMIRISRDREAQREVAHILVKSTAAVCTAIGTQPIPLADLPILTTLQLVMVSGIMYVSGRERSLRAATEFIGALGANVGLGMLLREGTRALLKFFPGWGNIICGMVAGAGTYGIGRAATVFFLDGVSLKDARRVYLKSRKRPVRAALEPPKRPAKAPKRRK
jgi:uncharacterized protein (DUF697 family)